MPYSRDSGALRGQRATSPCRVCARISAQYGLRRHPHVLFRLVLPSPSSRQSDAPWTSTVTPMQTLFLERPHIVLPSALRRRSSGSSGHYVSSSHILSERVAPSWQSAITPKSFAVHYAGVSKERWWFQAHAASLLLLKDLRQEHGPLRDGEDASSRRACRSQT